MANKKKKNPRLSLSRYARTKMYDRVRHIGDMTLTEAMAFVDLLERERNLAHDKIWQRAVARKIVETHDGGE